MIDYNNLKPSEKQKIKARFILPLKTKNIKCNENLIPYKKTLTGFIKCKNKKIC